ncbi:hypothetical protein BDN72DRAFT_900546 [Pluteus cervinus]|uniref:Uncharacterized protein n=1 Tax=Pluteus cervinus TaxID=181527 RepID=A0ACD3AJ85_9AGAR|nr:hypothetical protein BDN72DRAFT_900546 [Pluteus cervinus]
MLSTGSGSTLDTEYPLLCRVKSLVRAFGFCVHETTGSPLVDLGVMNVNGILDVVYTDDSDIFLFGGRSIIRSIDSVHSDKVMVYMLDDVDDTRYSRLTRGDFYLMNLLLDKEYSCGLLPGIDAESAYQLATRGYGEDLFQIATTADTPAAFKTATQSWSSRILTEFNVISSNKQAIQHPKLLEVITNTGLPSYESLRQYACPRTSIVHHDARFNSFSFQEPRVNEIASLCSQWLGWNSAAVLCQELAASLWESLCRHMMTSPYAIFDARSRYLLTPFCRIQIIRIGNPIRGQKRPVNTYRRLKVDVSNFYALAGLAPENGASITNLWVDQRIAANIFPTCRSQE